MKTLKVKAEDYARFLRARAAENAAKKVAERMKAAMGIPEASAKTEGDYILTDGNNQPIGKVKIAARAGYEVKPGWTARIS